MYKCVCVSLIFASLCGIGYIVGRTVLVRHLGWNCALGFKSSELGIVIYLFLSFLVPVLPKLK